MSFHINDDFVEVTYLLNNIPIYTYTNRILSGSVVVVSCRIHATVRVGKILTQFSPVHMRLIQQFLNYLLYTTYNIHMLFR